MIQSNDDALQIKELLRIRDEKVQVRLEYKNSAKNSYKFYQLTVLPPNHSIGEKNFKLVARWGRIGTDGQRQVKLEGSKEACLNNLNFLVREKTTKGYVRISG
jgi:predicted DNA-binding WGR domain protein